MRASEALGSAERLQREATKPGGTAPPVLDPSAPPHEAAAQAVGLQIPGITQRRSLMADFIAAVNTRARVSPEEVTAPPAAHALMPPPAADASLQPTRREVAVPALEAPPVPKPPASVEVEAAPTRQEAEAVAGLQVSPRPETLMVQRRPAASRRGDAGEGAGAAAEARISSPAPSAAASVFPAAGPAFAAPPAILVQHPGAFRAPRGFWAASPLRSVHLRLLR